MTVSATKVGETADYVQTIGAQTTYWDRVANQKRFSHPLRLDWLARYLKDAPVVLDYGCGYGRTLEELAAAGYDNLVGSDFSNAMLARARNASPSVGLVQNDGRSLPFQPNSVDLVILFAVLTCIPDDDEQRLLVAEIQRLLRPGGLLYISDLLLNEDKRNRERYDQYANAFGCYGVFELPEGVVVRHHAREWIEELTSVFERLEFEPFTVTTMNGNASSAFQYLGRKTD